MSGALGIHLAPPYDRGRALWNADSLYLHHPGRYEALRESLPGKPDVRVERTERGCSDGRERLGNELLDVDRQDFADLLLRQARSKLLLLRNPTAKIGVGLIFGQRRG